MGRLSDLILGTAMGRGKAQDKENQPHPPTHIIPTGHCISLLSSALLRIVCTLPQQHCVGDKEGSKHRGM